MSTGVHGCRDASASAQHARANNNNIIQSSQKVSSAPATPSPLHVLSPFHARTISQLQMDGTLPVQPILASTIFSSLPKGAETGVKRKRIGTECGPVDDALRGGIDGGKGGMTCISGEKGSGRTALAFAFLTSYILSSPNHQGVLVDTTGTFDVLRLYNTIEQRLRHKLTSTAIRKTANQELDPAFEPGARKPDAAEVEAEAQKMATAALDRVNIIRAFDFVGVVEAVGEVREKLEMPVIAVEQPPPPPDATAIAVGSKAAPAEQEKWQRTEIADSQDEDDDDDEMLFDASTMDINPNPQVECEQPERADERAGSPSNSHDDVYGQGRVGMIVIDNLTQVVSPIMKSNYTQAHALLTPFLRSLALLMNDHDISTVIINAAVPPLRTTRQGPQQEPQEQAHGSQKPGETRSIFASTTSHPALGRSFPHYIDLHLFVSRQPARRRDALALHGKAGGSPNMVNVVEVLNDRHDSRVGRWASFSVDERDGRLVNP